MSSAGFLHGVGYMEKGIPPKPWFCGLSQEEFTRELGPYLKPTFSNTMVISIFWWFGSLQVHQGLSPGENGQ